MYRFLVLTFLPLSGVFPTNPQLHASNSPTILKPILLKPPPSKGRPLVVQWTALGSACQAVAAKNNADVQLFILPGNFQSQQLVQFKLQPRRMQLHSPVLATNTKGSKRLAFARECAIRLGISPGKGRWVTGLQSTSRFQAKKSPLAAAKILQVFGYGSSNTQKKERIFARGEKLAGKDFTLKLKFSRKDGSLKPRCGQDELLSLDTIFHTQRQGFQDRVELKLVKDMEIAMTLEDCS